MPRLSQTPGREASNPADEPPTTIGQDYLERYGHDLATADRPQLERWLSDLRADALKVRCAA